MTSLFYFLLPAVILTGLVIFLAIRRKQNGRFELYTTALHNENHGRYILALNNYEEALDEIRRLNTRHSFRKKILQRIKIIRSTVGYEENFHQRRG